MTVSLYCLGADTPYRVGTDRRISASIRAWDALTGEMATAYSEAGRISHTEGRFPDLQHAIRQTEGMRAVQQLHMLLSFRSMPRLICRLQRVHVPSVWRIAPCKLHDLPSVRQIPADTEPPRSARNGVVRIQLDSSRRNGASQALRCRTCGTVRPAHAATLTGPVVQGIRYGTPGCERCRGMVCSYTVQHLVGVNDAPRHVSTIHCD